MRRFFTFICIAFLLQVPTSAKPGNPTLIFVTNQYMLGKPKIVYSLDVTTGQVEKLLTVDADKTAFEMSPSGRQLAYTAMNYYDTALYLFDLTSRVNRAVAPAAAIGTAITEPVPPSWSTNGQTVAVSSYNRAAQQPEIALVNSESETVLTPDYLPGKTMFQWSSDDQMLLYFSGNVPPYIATYVAVNIERPATAQVIFPSIGLYSRLMEWIPDTHEILTTQPLDENHIQFLRINAETGETRVIPTPVANNAVYNLWFLDSQTLLLADPMPALTLSRFHLDTGELEPIKSQDTPAHESLYYDRFILSPDGHYLAARSVSREAAGDIDFYEADTGALIQSSTNPDEKPSSGWIWSPDSHSLIFCTSDLQDHYSTYQIKVDGSSPAQVISDDYGGAILGWTTTHQGQ